MPNILDENGLQIKSNLEIIEDITNDLKSIFGNDINVDSNSPDGQMINIYVQVAIDLLSLLVDIFNSFAVNNTYGKILDQRVALNGIQRKEGTFTFTDVSITVDRALNLEGLDEDIEDPDGTGYTVSDDAGNQFILATSANLPSAETYDLEFRAKNIGKVETTINTITNQVTVVLGVTNVNNPTIATTIGTNEETDAELKIRRLQSFFLASISSVGSIESAIANINGVTDALVVENDTSEEVEGIPPHSIWAIVEDGTDEEIGGAIYAKKAPGCGMKGEESYTITRPNGTSFIAKFDRAILQDLWIRFSIIPKNPGITFDNDFIKQSLYESLNFKLNQFPSVGDIVNAMSTIEPLAILTSISVSDDGVDYYDIVYPETYQHKFEVSVDKIEIL